MAADAVRMGLLGKLPAHGDFVRRGDLPPAFCAAWDAWLQAGIAAARAAIGEDRWAAVWDAAPAWRFALPAGACGPDAAAGVLVPSRDTVGRRWPLTLAAVPPEPGFAWPAAWFATLEGVAFGILAGGGDADCLAAALPDPAHPAAADPLAGFWAALVADAGGGRNAGQEDPSPPASGTAMMVGEDVAAGSGWWTGATAGGEPGLVWPLAALPDPEAFVLLLETEP